MAGTPFSTPVAPVAGFSPQQLQAFNEVGANQGYAQPYINTAANYFSPAGAQGFLNPYTANVTANLQDIFGQQNVQNTGALTQAAGGVGADRIAVGQSELAKQQGLAAGQTYANLYGNAANLAQSAGFGTANLGTAGQNAAFQGAQMLLGTGGLQQQEQQAQLNAPYQNVLQQIAWPYQNAQFLAGITGALAPGLGGTTTGQGTTTYPGPSWLGTIAGLGMTGAGVYGLGNQQGWWGSGKGSGGGGQAPSARGGRIHPYASGGATDDADMVPAVSGDPFLRMVEARNLQSAGADAPGGGPIRLPTGVNAQPIDAEPQSIVPQGGVPAIQPRIPQLNLSTPAPSGGGKGSGLGDVLSTGLKVASMFRRGGAAHPYSEAEHMDDGGVPVSPNDRVAQAWDNANRWNTQGAGLIPGDAHTPDLLAAAPDVPLPRARPDISAAAPPAEDADLPPSATPTAGLPDDAPSNPYAPPNARQSLANSPWMPLITAGLGTLAAAGSRDARGLPISPAAAIGAGGLQGVKTLESQRAAEQKQESIDQAARRLDQVAQFHRDQYTKMTPYQQAEIGTRQYAQTHMTPYQEAEASKPFVVGQNALGLNVYGRRLPNGQIVDAATGQPITDKNTAAPKNTDDEAALPPTSTPTATGDIRDESVLREVDPKMAATIRAIDEGRTSIASVPLKMRGQVLNLVNAYDPSWDQTTWAARNRMQSDLAPNGNSGKLLLAVNQLLPHLKVASDKAAALDNGNFPAANAVTNWLLTQAGDPRVTSFNTVREVAALDAARLLRGSGAMAEADINNWRELLASSGSPRQLQENIGLLSDELIGARVSSIEHSYRMIMRKDPPSLVSDEAKDALAAIQKRRPKAPGEAAPAAQQPAPAPTAAAPAPAAVPPTRVRQNGHTYERQQDGSYRAVD